MRSAGENRLMPAGAGLSCGSMGGEPVTGGRVLASVRVNGALLSTASDPPDHAIVPIYSVTKTLTAICVLRLVEEGSLQLSESANLSLPEPRLPDAITIERVTSRRFANAIDRFVVEPLALRDTFVLEDIGDLARCVPGFGSEVTTDGSVVDVRDRYHPGWCAPRLIASTTGDVTRVFDALIAGDLLQPRTLADMLTLAPLEAVADETIFGGMGVYSDQASRWGRNYHHAGGGPGYKISATVYPDTPLGRVAIAVVVTTSGGPEATDCETPLLAQLLDQTD